MIQRFILVLSMEGSSGLQLDMVLGKEIRVFDLDLEAARSD